MAKKNNRIKREVYRSEEQQEMFRFIKILILVVLVVLAVYLFTRIFITKDMFNNKEEETKVTEGVINYDVSLIGAMLNKPEEEYYVIIYNTEDLNAVYYSGLVSNYKSNKDSLRVYMADLNNALNKKYYDKDNVNLNVTSPKDLKVGDLTLIKIKNGEIVKALNSEEEIASELVYVKDTAK